MSGEYSAVVESRVEPVCFDDRYVEGLRSFDSAIESHFVTYFELPIRLTARRQLRSHDLVEDACQETLLRVLRYFRSGKALDSPERLPAFVHSVCHNVTLEIIRGRTRYAQMPDDGYDCADTREDAYSGMVTEERKKLVREILSRLPKKDRELLRLALLEETDKDELCRRFGATEQYLRVLLHRARGRFRTALFQTGPVRWATSKTTLARRTSGD